jgi:hypothetical protein
LEPNMGDNDNDARMPPRRLRPRPPPGPPPAHLRQPDLEQPPVLVPPPTHLRQPDLEQPPVLVPPPANLRRPSLEQPPVLVQTPKWKVPRRDGLSSPSLSEPRRLFLAGTPSAAPQCANARPSAAPPTHGANMMPTTPPGPPPGAYLKSHGPHGAPPLPSGGKIFKMFPMTTAHGAAMPSTPPGAYPATPPDVQESAPSTPTTPPGSYLHLLRRAPPP